MLIRISKQMNENAELPGRVLTIPNKKTATDDRITAELIDAEGKRISRRTLDSLFNQLPFYILLVDEDHYIMYANQAIKDQYGLDPDEIIGLHCPKAVHGQDGSVPLCPLEECVEKNTAIEREITLADQRIWLKSAVYPTEYRTAALKRVYLHMVHDISKQRIAEEALKKSLTKLNILSESIIRAITALVEDKDLYTAGHQQRVSDLAYAIANHMGLNKKKTEGIRVAGLLHDIGKIAIPIEILCKPAKLTDDEFQLIKTHPQYGYDILKNIPFEWPIAQIVLQHHERIDGSGYPYHLSADDIMAEAKILGVADVVEAMTSHRPYRAALGVEAALDEIVQKKNTLYDPNAVNACVKLFSSGRYSF